jgi:large conductance mechanosensitive channel
MLKGFKEFIMQGDVIALAVSFVIGLAFAAMVSTFVSSVITPVLAAAGGAHAVSLGVDIRPGNNATRIDFGAMINAIIVFLITALVVYLIFVVPKRKYDDWKAKRAGIVEEEPPVEESTQLLREIRDSLANRPLQP